MTTKKLNASVQVGQKRVEWEKESVRVRPIQTIPKLFFSISIRQTAAPKICPHFLLKNFRCLQATAEICPEALNWTGVVCGRLLKPLQM